MKKRRFQRRVGGEGLSQEEYNNLPETISDYDYRFGSDPKLFYYDRKLVHVKLPKNQGNTLKTKRNKNQENYLKRVAEAEEQQKRVYDEQKEAQRLANIANIEISKKILTQQEYNQLQPNEKSKWIRANPQSNSKWYSPKYTYRHMTRGEILESQVLNPRKFPTLRFSPDEYNLLSPKAKKLLVCEREQTGMQEWSDYETCRRR